MYEPVQWAICPIDGCLVSQHDVRCPACQYRLMGPLETAWTWVA